MKKVLQIVSAFLLSSLLILSCSKDNEEDVTQNPPGGGGGTNNPPACDTVNMAYTNNVKPILQGSCYGCHGNGQANGGVTLDTYAGVKAVVDNGKLIGVISHAAGFKQMPQGGAKLPDCNINKIRGWINRGALNN